MLRSSLLTVPLGYARWSRLACVINLLPRMPSYFWDTTLELTPNRLFMISSGHVKPNNSRQFNSPLGGLASLSTVAPFLVFVALSLKPGWPFPAPSISAARTGIGGSNRGPISSPATVNFPNGPSAFVRLRPAWSGLVRLGPAWSGLRGKKDLKNQSPGYFQIHPDPGFRQTKYEDGPAFGPVRWHTFGCQNFALSWRNRVGSRKTGLMLRDWPAKWSSDFAIWENFHSVRAITQKV